MMIIKMNLADKKVGDLFRYGLVRDILLFTGKNSGKEFTISAVAKELGLKPNTGNLRRAVKLLVDSGLLVERKSGRGRFLKINTETMVLPSSPYALIPQAEYRDVVMKVAERLKRVKGIVKIILFGGVARGAADRMSDIDVLVVGRISHRISSEVSRLMRECRNGEFLGERYGLSIRTVDTRELERPRGFVKDALTEGIVLYKGG